MWTEQRKKAKRVVKYVLEMCVFDMLDFKQCPKTLVSIGDITLKTLSNTTASN